MSTTIDDTAATSTGGVKPLVPMLSLRHAAPRVHQLLFGDGRVYASASDMQRDQLRQRFIGELTQRNQFECILDANPAHRFDFQTEPGYRTRRYDVQPHAMFTAQVQPQRENPERCSLSVYAKSRVTEQGQLEPVAPLSSDIWEEEVPIRLAELVYAHVYSTNKPKASAEMPTTMTPEMRMEMESVLRETVRHQCAAGSPLTSTTLNSLVDHFLQAWGKPGKHVSVDADGIRMVSPAYLTALILFVASDANADTPISFDWRQKFAELGGKDETKMAALLEKHGINPTGPWTHRDRCAYYALVAAEHMVIGATPAGTVSEVESRQE